MITFELFDKDKELVAKIMVVEDKKKDIVDFCGMKYKRSGRTMNRNYTVEYFEHDD